VAVRHTGFFFLEMTHAAFHDSPAPARARSRTRLTPGGGVSTRAHGPLAHPATRQCVSVRARVRTCRSVARAETCAETRTDGPAQRSNTARTQSSTTQTRRRRQRARTSDATGSCREPLLQLVFVVRCVPAAAGARAPRGCSVERCDDRSARQHEEESPAACSGRRPCIVRSRPFPG